MHNCEIFVEDIAQCTLMLYNICCILHGQRIGAIALIYSVKLFKRKIMYNKFGGVIVKLDNLGAKMHRNLTVGKLVETALRKEGAVLTNTGALSINTGKYTGRSPGDRFIVDEPSIHDKIDWGKVNVPISSEKFENLYGVKNFLDPEYFNLVVDTTNMDPLETLEFVLDALPPEAP